MRGLAASLAGLIGLGALVTLGACTDSTDTDNVGGAGGASGSATAGGSSAGAHSAGTSGEEAGAAGAPAGQCTFLSTACQTCLGTKCLAKVGACEADDACSTGLGTLPNCVCDSANTSESCQAAFVQDGGDPAVELAQCYTLNCTAACE